MARLIVSGKGLMVKGIADPNRKIVLASGKGLTPSPSTPKSKQPKLVN